MPAFPAKTNYAAGDILTSAQMVDVGNAINALNGTAGKNKIINGDFGIWQRGTSFTGVSYGNFYADRYLGGTDGTGVTRTVSQQTFTPGTAPVSGYEANFFMRVNQSVGGTGAGYNVIDTKIEDVRTLSGQSVTFSFWAKADSNRTISGTFGQQFGASGSATVETSFGNFAITTSWQRFSSTISTPSLTGKTIGAGSHLYIRLNIPINTTFTIDTWGWQLEAGSTATNFTTATGTIQGELAACQRYCMVYGGFANVGVGFAAGSTQVPRMVISAPVQMRTTPSGSYTGTPQLYDGVNTTNISSLGTFHSGARNNITFDVNVASGLAQFRGYSIYMNDGTLTLAAEL